MRDWEKRKGEKISSKPTKQELPPSLWNGHELFWWKKKEAGNRDVKPKLS
jgi:hypothetical protein